MFSRLNGKQSSVWPAVLAGCLLILIAGFVILPMLAEAQLDVTSWLSSAPIPEGAALEQVNLPEQAPYVPTDAAMGDSERAAAHLHVTGSALKLRRSGVDYQATGGGGCICADSSTYTVWNTPMMVPDGSIVN